MLVLETNSPRASPSQGMVKLCVCQFLERMMEGRIGVVFLPTQ